MTTNGTWTTQTRRDSKLQGRTVISTSVVVPAQDVGPGTVTVAPPPQGPPLQVVITTVEVVYLVTSYVVLHFDQ